MCGSWLCVFFFQAEDGIRDVAVTGVQTCALPILRPSSVSFGQVIYFSNNYFSFSFHRSLKFKQSMLSTKNLYPSKWLTPNQVSFILEIGRASCRERV